MAVSSGRRFRPSAEPFGIQRSGDGNHDLPCDRARTPCFGDRPMTSQQGQLYRFLLEQAGVRGTLVRLGGAWRAVLGQHEYPSTVRGQLGQALAASALLSSTIKFEGSLILQAQTTGPLQLLVAQTTRQRTLRGLARWDSEVPEGDLQQVFGCGVLGITIDIPGGERYQGLVPLEGTDLAEAIATYFARSEQLDTRLWLWADERRAAGLLVQRLPEAGRRDDWERIAASFASVPETDLVSLRPELLLPRIWGDQPIRLFDPESIAFRCGCSPERIESALRALGREEVMAILEERGAIEADCEFCNRHYYLDRVDAERIFVETTRVQAPNTRQ